MDRKYNKIISSEISIKGNSYVLKHILDNFNEICGIMILHRDCMRIVLE